MDEKSDDRFARLTYLLKTGTRKALVGDFEPIKDYARRRFLRLENEVKNSLHEYITGPTVHIRPYNHGAEYTEEPLYYSRADLDGAGRYHRIVDSEKLAFSAPEQFEGISFDLFDVRNIDACRVEVNFELAGVQVDTFEVEVRDAPEFKEGSPTPRWERHERPYFPIELSTDGVADSAVIAVTEIEWSTGPSKARTKAVDVDDGWVEKGRNPAVSLPTIHSSRAPDVPIFLISVDTLRFDYLDRLSGVVEELGSDAVRPSDPRTQGVCTWPSLASMFTGVHPGTHGSQAVERTPFQGSLETLPEFLEDLGYGCSACVGSHILDPELGFGRGFHRYEVQPISYRARRFDAVTNVTTVENWARSDLPTDASQFYFLHVFDAHYPYFPPLPVRNLTQVDYQLRFRTPSPSKYRNYLQLLDEDPIEIDERDLDLMKQYYGLSLEHVDRQLVRLIQSLKRIGKFDESLIIITGDHGEEFYENKFMYHHSLYNRNIRPGMLVKPPSGTDLDVPNEVDTIDFFPSIARLVGEEAPEQCQGRAWQDAHEGRPRVSERFVDTYNIAVETDGVKGIFTFEKDGPHRPRSDQFGAALREEYYTIGTDGYELPGSSNTVTGTTKRELRSIGERFLRENEGISEYREIETSDEVKRRLEMLGYG